MKKILSIVVLTVYCLSAYSQDNVTIELKKLSDNNEFKTIIEKHASKSKDYSAKSIYYIGLAYYMTEDDENCIKFMDISIDKNPNDHAPYFIKASTLNYMGKYKEAIKCFKSAIVIKNDDARLYSGLGDSYTQLEKYDLALEAYINATKLENCIDRPYSMIAQIYSEQNKNDKALEAFHIARDKISKTSSSYINVLYNIGLLEYLKGNYEEAEPAFVELLQLDSNDFHTYAKLIQIYYAKEEYEKAKPYRDKLYNASEKGMLKGNMEDMFCFDQFKWDDKLIQGFERYEEGPKSEIFNKHLFYVKDEDGEIEYRIQTEYSPISVELGEAKYILCMTKGSTHSTFSIGFNDDFDYAQLKKAVIDVLEGNIKAGASSKPKRR